MAKTYEEEIAALQKKIAAIKKKKKQEVENHYKEIGRVMVDMFPDLMDAFAQTDTDTQTFIYSFFNMTREDDSNDTTLQESQNGTAETYSDDEEYSDGYAAYGKGMQYGEAYTAGAEPR